MTEQTKEKIREALQKGKDADEGLAFEFNGLTDEDMFLEALALLDAEPVMVNTITEQEGPAIAISTEELIDVNIFAVRMLEACSIACEKSINRRVNDGWTLEASHVERDMAIAALISADRRAVLEAAAERAERQIGLCANNTDFEESTEWLQREIRAAIMGEIEE